MRVRIAPTRLAGLAVVALVYLVAAATNAAQAPAKVNSSSSNSGSSSSTGSHKAIGVGRTVLLGKRTKTSGCRLGANPDRRCSPGAYYSGLTKKVICSASFHTSSIGNVPKSEKYAVEREYRMTPGSYGRTLEIDHIVPLELGGANDIANLFPEKANAHPGYRVKDTLEKELHRRVCSGGKSLRSAQREIATNWQTLFKKVLGTIPAEGTVTTEGTVPAVAKGRTYYVSPSGNDRASGTTSASPWKTVSRANNANLAPGDSVLFQGGQTFSDATLEAHNSGTNAAPITFGSYGTGQANLRKGVYLLSVGHLVFNNIAVIGTGFNDQGLSASGRGLGTTDVTVENSSFQNIDIAVNLPNTSDAGWTIKGNTITDTGDSGIIVVGHDVTITGNTISNVGQNSSITYGKHGIYAKGPNLTISNNDISGSMNGQALSIRAHGDQVYGNTIHDMAEAIAFFDFDESAAPQGTSYIYDNRVWNISERGFYYAGELDPQGRAPSVSFVVANNTFILSGGEAIALKEVPGSASVTVANNVFSGSYDAAYQGCDTCTEFGNDWSGAAGWLPAGRGDIFVPPMLSTAPELAPQSGSPLIDAGTSDINGLTYSAACDGLPLHYCGLRPDIGAVEKKPDSVVAPPSPAKTSSGEIASAKLSEKSFSSAEAAKVKLTCSFSSESKLFAYVLSLRRGTKWTVVKSAKKTGSFKKYTLTVKQLFAGKPIKRGRYRLRLSADKNSRLLRFRVT